MALCNLASNICENVIGEYSAFNVSLTTVEHLIFFVLGFTRLFEKEG